MKPTVSIIMPALNSEKTIEESLISVRSQNYNQKLIEILVIDGGSKDKTISIAKKYKCKILKNRMVQQEYAKHIGILRAHGRFVIFLDSDEVLENLSTIKSRVNIFKTDKKVKILFSGGYKPPKTSSLTNKYVNTFGDPFAYFMYGVSPDAEYFLRDYKNKYRSYKEYDKYVIFKFTKLTHLPLMDLCAGLTFDKKYVNRIINDLSKSPRVVARIPFLLMRNSRSIAIMKDDPIIHNSVDSPKRFLNKLRWRVIVNLHFVDHPGTGFSNRENYQPLSFNLKKYLFIPFALSALPAFIVSIYFIFYRRKLAAILHIFFTLYVAICIVYYYILKSLSIKPNLFVYGKYEK